MAAKHMPGDYHIEHASPWAGADYMPVSLGGTDAAEWDKNTWPYLRDLAQNHPDAGIHFQSRNRDIQSNEGSRILNTKASAQSLVEGYVT
ncbi:hypothetical protein MMC11_000396 [Xylographa trunciseda]|nr:hypothetical protein [Xylographa trunciseda]